MVGLRFLDQVQFHVHAARPHFAAVAGIVHILRDEYGVAVAGSERLELLQDAEEFRGNLRKIQPGINLRERGQHLRGDLSGDESIDAGGEFRQVLLLEGEARGVHVSAEVFQQVGTALNGLVQVESRHAAGRTGHESVRFGEHDGGAVIGLYQPGSDDAHHALVPLRVKDDGRILMRQAFPLGDHVQGLLGDFPVDIFALVVVVVDLLADAEGGLVVRSRQQFHRQASALHPARRVDARSDFEHDVVDAHVAGLQFGEVDHGQQALAGIFVEPAQAEMGQHAVLAHHGHQVRRNAHHQQVQQRKQRLKRNVVPLGIALYQLEAHAATGQVVERIVAVFPLGIQDRDRFRKSLFRKMVVADNHIDSLVAGVFHLFDGLDAAIQGDDQGETVVRGPVDAFVGDAVPLVISVRDVIVDLLRKTPQEGIDQGHRRGTIHIIIAIDQDLFALGNRLADPLHGGVHIGHQEGIVQIIQAGTEERAGLLEGLYAPLDQQFGQDPVNAEFGRQRTGLCGVGRFFDDPFPFLEHTAVINQTKIAIFLYLCKIVNQYRRILWQTSNAASRKSCAGNPWRKSRNWVLIRIRQPCIRLTKPPGESRRNTIPKKGTCRTSASRAASCRGASWEPLPLWSSRMPPAASRYM